MFSNFFFFFKQKTAYEMRISDWSSDVCSSDLKTTLERVLPYWHDAIAPQLKVGQTVLVTAHGNSLRALYKYLNKIADEAILEVNIPTGIPLLFDLHEDLRVKSYRYLGDAEAAKKAAEAVANQAKTRS